MEMEVVGGGASDERSQNGGLGGWFAGGKGWLTLGVALLWGFYLSMYRNIRPVKDENVLLSSDYVPN